MDFNFFLTVFHSSFVFTDRRQVASKLNLTNVEALNYLLRSEIFISEDRQLRAVHLILDFQPILETFQKVGHTIRVGDPRLARIKVSRPNFLALYNLPPVAHPFQQFVPLVIQPVQQVPPETAVAREGIASSNSSLEEEIDKFQFEEEENQRVQVIPVSDVEDEQDRHSNIHAPALVIARLDDTSEEEEDGIGLNKGGKSLWDLMATRNKGSTSKDANMPQIPTYLPPPPPLPVTSTGLIPNPDLKKKRKVPEVHEVEEVR